MKIKKLFVSIGLVSIIIVMTSCNFLPQGIKNLFATKTSTSTSTPKATSTPRATATPTSTATAIPTPMPPVMIYPCVFLEECSQAKPIEDYIDSDAAASDYYFLQIPYNQPIQLITGWYAKNEDFLQDNLEHIQWVFTIDGQDYTNLNWIEGGEVPDAESEYIAYPGKWFGVVMQGWEIGETHEIKIGITFTETIYDGWENTDAGTSYITTYELIAANLPTATFTPQATATRTPVVATRAPAAQSTTAVPSSDDNASVEHRLGTVPVTITNNKSVAVRIVAVGPTTYTVTVNGGQTINVRWAPGSYSLTAYVNGSYYASTTWDVNENHALFTIN